MKVLYEIYTFLSKLYCLYLFTASNTNCSNNTDINNWQQPAAAAANLLLLLLLTPFITLNWQRIRPGNKKEEVDELSRNSGWVTHWWCHQHEMPEQLLNLQPHRQNLQPGPAVSCLSISCAHSCSFYQNNACFIAAPLVLLSTINQGLHCASDKCSQH